MCLPAQVTQVRAFLSAHPEHDGRGTVIAVLDTGVDPAALGMQTASTGGRKVIRLVDCSGGGDVDMSAVAKPTPENTLAGISGLTLRIPAAWPKPVDGTYRVGLKRQDGIFPKEVATECAKKRRAFAERENNALIVKALKHLAEHHKKFPSLLASDAEFERRADLKARIELLKDFMKEYKDPGASFDCIVFNDGTKWLAAVDVSQTGNLEDTLLMSSFHEDFQFHTFGEDSRLTYSVNILDGGDLLSIVTTSGSHGTHVACIAAAHFPDNESGFDGVAPGAEVISLKIGDGRVGGAETTQSLVRAALELTKLKVDVVNVSYGEFAGTYDYGRFTELINDEVINKLGTIFVTSAGNAGPILSSLSHPAGGSGVITVGAYVTKQMQEDMYALLSTVTDRPLSFTSMGPTLDGSVGVDIYAPGAAITSVPQFTKKANQLMNGTSMASPNAAGCVALLVSGLKSDGKAVNPYRVGHALRATSKQFGDAFGVGIVQVLDAWEFLNREDVGRLWDALYNFDVKDLNRGRGIYLRNPVETASVQQLSFTVAPRFLQSNEPSSIPLKLAYDAHLRLEASHKWIQAPDFFRLAQTGRDVVIRVDPTALEPGLHVGFVIAYDARAIATNSTPVFKFPITVCKAEKEGGKDDHLSLRVFKSVHFIPGDVQRRYFDVPAGANFATLSLKVKDRVGGVLFMIQFGQLHQQAASDTFETRTRATMGSTTSGVADDDYKWSKTFRVVSGKTAELVLCQVWSTLGPTSMDFDLTFHGLELTASNNPSNEYGSVNSGDLIYLNAGNASFSRCDLTSKLRTEYITSVSVVFNALQKALRPTDSNVLPLRERDVLPDGRQLFQLVLTYNLKLTDDVNVTPVFPQVLGSIYDSNYESFLIQIFDQQQLLQSVHHSKERKSKLKEGSYTIKIQVVSSDIGALEKLKMSPLLVNIELKKSITLSTYKTLAGAVTGSGAIEKTSLKRGQSTTFYVPAIEDSSIPKSSSSGDILLGTFKVLDSDISNGNSTLELFKAAYLVPTENKSKDASSADVATPVLREDTSASIKAKEDPAMKLQEELRDVEISFIKKITDAEKRNALIDKLEKEHSTFVPFLVARLEAYASEFEKALKKDANAVVEADVADKVYVAASVVLDKIDQSALAQYLALKTDMAAGGEAAKTRKKEMDAQKAAISLALLWKARLSRNTVLSEVTVADVSAEDVKFAVNQFEESLVALSKWIASPATSDGKYLLLWVWRLRRDGNTGSALKAVVKYLSDSKNVGNADSDKNDKNTIWKELNGIRQDLLKELGWTLWVDHELRCQLEQNPTGFALF
ncbi:hypothetical protein BC830DRAFT_1144258 [Chytriomyces sp. MP71]|nr:hypothetical protein BC830DRAFT_1144258 [Chytriomyces sp. MP71]